MNGYIAWIPDGEGQIEVRSSHTYYEPPEPEGMCEVIAANTPGQARSTFIKVMSEAYGEDYTHIRVLKFASDIDAKLGAIHIGPLHHQGWERFHEVLDHAGKKCDCPEDFL